MSEGGEAGRLSVIWSPEGRAELRAIDRERAVNILHCIARYLQERTGDIKKLQPPLSGMRLRCGDYPVLFDVSGTPIEITGVRHRRKAYRSN